MRDERKSGIAMVAGSLGAIITMAVHPVGPGALTTLTAESVARLTLLSGLAHSLAMLSILALVLGAFGLARRLAAPDRLAFAGLVTYAFAAVAVFIATAVSGFIVPGIMRHMVRDAAAAASTWQIAIISIVEINQAFASIYSVATALAIALWSAAGLRNGRLGRGLAIYGCVSAPLLMLAIAIGHLRMDVHGMAIVVVLQGIWFLVAASQLYREEPRHA